MPSTKLRNVQQKLAKKMGIFVTWSIHLFFCIMHLYGVWIRSGIVFFYIFLLSMVHTRWTTARPLNAANAANLAVQVSPPEQESPGYFEQYASSVEKTNETTPNSSVEVEHKPLTLVEPWSDADGVEEKKRIELFGGELGLRGGLEYRINTLWINPLDVVNETNRKFLATDQRLRLDGSVDYKDIVRVTTSIDLLDGVLWGDNGFAEKGAPEPWSGSNLSTKNVNVARPCITLVDEAAPTDPNSYRYGLCDAAPIFIRRLYADLLTPIGMLRIGRQAYTEGSTVSVNDGDGRRNRFGFSGRGNSADRILFATKPLEGFKPDGKRNRSQYEGLFLILAYDRLVQDDVQKWSDDLHEWTTAIRLLDPKYGLGENLEIRAAHTYRWDTKYDTGIHSFTLRALSKFGRISAGIDASATLGATREVSEAYRLIHNDPITTQTISQFGARATIRYDEPKWTAYLEGDFASGDSDPSVDTPLTQFFWAEDSNVGLLMFKHTLAYQTARSAAAGSRILKDLKAPTIPVDAVYTRGAFTNAAAIFPQFDFKPNKEFLFRAGVLIAWAPSKVNDPIQSQQRKDGRRIDDDLINFAGGKPGYFYGTELDLRAQYKFMNHVNFDLEGAFLFTGDAFAEVNGYTSDSYLVQARTTVFF